MSFCLSPIFLFIYLISISVEIMFSLFIYFKVGQKKNQSAVEDSRIGNNEFQVFFFF